MKEQEKIKSKISERLRRLKKVLKKKQENWDATVTNYSPSELHTDKDTYLISMR